MRCQRLKVQCPGYEAYDGLTPSEIDSIVERVYREGGREKRPFQGSCRRCRKAKTRCSQKRPACARCQQQGLACEYVLPHRGRRLSSAAHASMSSTVPTASVSEPSAEPTSPQLSYGSGQPPREIDDEEEAW